MIEHELDGESDRFPVVRISEINAEPVSQSWLIEDLWTASSVGWVAGQPKSFKSWTALEMAVSVASGTPCLGRFKVQDRGKVLIYLAEDSLRAVRERLEALSKRHRLAIGDLDIDVITASRMRLDLGRDQIRLQKTVRALSPRLLVLDPLVRIHGADENSSAEISSLLAYLRALQREFDVSIVVVHHVRKSAAPSQSAGQGLRGSGDLHAWSDCASYLRRKGDDVIVTVEHRSARAPSPFAVRLVVGEGGHPHLEIIDLVAAGAERQRSVEERLREVLEESAPLSRSALREMLSVRNERLGQALEELLKAGTIERTSEGWKLSDSQRSVPPVGMNGNGTIHLPPSGPKWDDDDADGVLLEAN
jgi:hypothetical protein